MSLTRKLLESLGLEADKVSTIIEAHAETVDALKSQIDTYKADAEKVSTLQKELSTAQTELEGLKTAGGDWKSKYDAISTEFESFKAEQNAKELTISKEKAYRQLLKDTGVSDKRLDSILKVTDLNSIELDEDGSIKDKDKHTESIKNDWSDFIVSSQTSGAKTDTPPTTNTMPRYSHEDIAKMSHEEINTNWESIKQSMKGNE